MERRFFFQAKQAVTKSGTKTVYDDKVANNPGLADYAVIEDFHSSEGEYGRYNDYACRQTP